MVIWSRDGTTQGAESLLDPQASDVSWLFWRAKQSIFDPHTECSTQDGDSFLASHFWAVEPPGRRHALDQFWSESCNSHSSGHRVVSDTFRFEGWRFLDAWLLNFWLMSCTQACLMTSTTIINRICIRTPSTPWFFSCGPRNSYSAWRMQITFTV